MQGYIVSSSRLFDELYLAERFSYPRLKVVLDMDECLLHSEFFRSFSSKSLFSKRSETYSRNIETHDQKVESFEVVIEDGTEVTVYKRPGLSEFLNRVCKEFETYIFTAGQEYYSRPLLDILDPEQKLFQGRFYRTSCTKFRGKYVKDLSEVLQTDDLARVVLVDNNPMSFIPQPNNGIPITSFYDDPNDRAFEEVTEVLAELNACKDVRVPLRRRYHLDDVLRNVTQRGPVDVVTAV